MPEFQPAQRFLHGPGRKMPGRSDVGEEVAAVLRDEGAEWRSGEKARRKEGEKGRRGEGEKCERFRIYYREVPRRAFCGGVL